MILPHAITNVQNIAGNCVNSSAFKAVTIKVVLSLRLCQLHVKYSELTSNLFNVSGEATVVKSEEDKRDDLKPLSAGATQAGSWCLTLTIKNINISMQSNSRM
jgi:hypothetical protein